MSATDVKKQIGPEQYEALLKRLKEVNRDIRARGWSCWEAITMDGLNHPVFPVELREAALTWVESARPVLEQAGASLKDVVRTRLFVTDISRWEEYGRAHGEYFGAIKPCTTMVEVSSLIAPEYLIEIEATAIIAAN